MKVKIYLILAFFVCLVSGGIAYAENPDQPLNLSESYPLDSQNRLANAFGGKLKIILPKETKLASSTVEVLSLSEEVKMPWRIDALSKVYQFDIKGLDLTKPIKPFSVEIAYETPSNWLKTVYFFDKDKNIWKPLPTKDFPEKNIARAEISLSYARVAVFEDREILVQGTASWYKYKTGNYAASPDFPKGSKLRVTNIDNGKQVDVVINDYGPERNKFPNRVIDLEKTAFAKILSTKSGLAKIRIEYLGTVDSKTKKFKAAALKRDNEEVDLASKARSAIAVNEKTGEVFFDKDSATTSPLASLSKLVAIKVFLDTRPTLSQVVPYSIADENFNYLYAAKSESARVKLKDGETLTIEDLLYSALVGSANNAVESLVRISGMGRDAFISKMNETVVGWGASSTVFYEPTGLSPQNVSSPRDYAIITREVFVHPIIQKASTMLSYKFTTKNLKVKHTIRNTNQLVEENKLKITGSKTGYLNEAGYCLMTRAKAANGDQIIVVTFGVPTKADSIAETKDLIEYSMKKMDGVKAASL